MGRPQAETGGPWTQRLTVARQLLESQAKKQQDATKKQQRAAQHAQQARLGLLGYCGIAYVLFRAPHASCSPQEANYESRVAQEAAQELLAKSPPPPHPVAPPTPTLLVRTLKGEAYTCSCHYRFMQVNDARSVYLNSL